MLRLRRQSEFYLGMLAVVVPAATAQNIAPLEINPETRDVSVQ